MFIGWSSTKLIVYFPSEIHHRIETRGPNIRCHKRLYSVFCIWTVYVSTNFDNYFIFMKYYAYSLFQIQDHMSLFCNCLRWISYFSNIISDRRSTVWTGSAWSYCAYGCKGILLRQDQIFLIKTHCIQIEGDSILGSL